MRLCGDDKGVVEDELNFERLHAKLVDKVTTIVVVFLTRVSSTNIARLVT